MKFFLVLICLMFIDTTLANKSLKSEKAALDEYLCLATKTEYFHCKEQGLTRCMKSNKERYNTDLACRNVLKGLKLEGWSEEYKFRPFEWTETCISVKKEFYYCKKKQNIVCVDSMKERYDEINCSKILEFDLK